jgi:hypothetical protein
VRAVTQCSDVRVCSADHLVKEFPCLLVEHVTLAGTLYVFNSHVCIGARFFDADIRRTSTIGGMSDMQPLEAGAITLKTHTGERIHCDVGAGQRDVLLGMLRLFAAQAIAQGPLSPHHTPPATQVRSVRTRALVISLCLSVCDNRLRASGACPRTAARARIRPSTRARRTSGRWCVPRAHVLVMTAALTRALLCEVHGRE